jgi:hypothetical protein
MRHFMLIEYVFVYRGAQNTVARLNLLLKTDESIFKTVIRLCRRNKQKKGVSVNKTEALFASVILSKSRSKISNRFIRRFLSLF